MPTGNRLNYCYTFFFRGETEGSLFNDCVRCVAIEIVDLLLEIVDRDTPYECLTAGRSTKIDIFKIRKL